MEFVPQYPPKDLINYCKYAEDNGVNYLWITDHFNNRQVFEMLALLADKTSRIKMGTGITNTFTHSPADTATAIATLDELSDGRACCGIGPGDLSTLPKIGIQVETPVSRLVEAVGIMRTFWSGAPVNTMNNNIFKFNGAALAYKPKQKNIPVYIGAQGEKMTETAGKIGDGSLINASNPKDFQVAIPIINKAKGDKKFDVAGCVGISIDQDAKKAKSAVKPVAAFITAGSPPAILQRHGLDPKAVAIIRDALGKGDFKTAFGTVNDAMIDAFSVYGTPEQVNAKLDELFKLGVNQVVVGSPIGPDRYNSIRLIGKYVIK
jgi:5,10-methylenetetrahydromethanopterin reductase